MSTSTPAAQLARLRSRFPLWRFYREDGRQQEAASGPGYIGPATWHGIRRTPDRLHLTAESAAALETQVISHGNSR